MSERLSSVSWYCFRACFTLVRDRVMALPGDADLGSHPPNKHTHEAGPQGGSQPASKAASKADQVLVRSKGKRIG